MTPEQLEKLGKDLDERVEKANGQTRESVKGVETSLKSEIKNLTDKYNEDQVKAGEITKKQQEQLDHISTQLKRGDLTMNQLQKSFSSIFTEKLEKENDALQAVKKSQSARYEAQFETKAVVMENGSLTGDVVNPDRRPGIVMPMERKIHMRELLFRGTSTSSNKWSYTQESGYNDGTATVAEGAAIPKSDLTMEQKSVDVKKIGATMDVSNEILEDIVGLLGYLQGRMNTKYKFKEDNQLLFGSGTGTDIRGVYTAATAFAAHGVKPTNSPNYWDALAVAADQMAIAEYAANAAVISRSDFTRMGLTKNANGDYILPILFMAGSAQQRIIDLLIVPTTAMPDNTFLVGDFENASEIVDRRLVDFQVSNENKDNFERDLVTLRLTARLALPIYYTGGFVKGTFTGTGGAIPALSA